MNIKNLKKIEAWHIFLLGFNYITIIVFSFISIKTYSRMSDQPRPNEAYQAYKNMFVNQRAQISDRPPVANIFMISELPPE
jgi:hypothetical protein